MQNIVYVEPSKSLNGVLRFQSLNEEFVSRSESLLDRFQTLIYSTDLTEIDRIVSELDLKFEFVGSARQEYDRQKRLIELPFTVDSPFFNSGKKLFEFQHYGMNAASDRDTQHIILQWDTGAGKTVAGTQVTERLFQDDVIDVAILLCERIKKRDWRRAYEVDTNRKVRIIDGNRQYRHSEYKKKDAEVYVMNYEKIRGPSVSGRGRKKSYSWDRTDLWQLMEVLEGRRVLIIADEAQKIGNSTSQTHLGFARLVKQTNARVIALTATPYVTSPYNIRNIVIALNPKYPLSPVVLKDDGSVLCSAHSRSAFESEYVQEFGHNRFEKYVKKWNHKTLPKLGKRIDRISSLAMKSDERIARQFPNKIERLITLGMSEFDEEVYSYAKLIARRDWEEDNTVANFATFNAMRMLLNTTESVQVSQSKLCQELKENKKLNFSTKESAKFQSLASSLEDIFEQKEKVVIFTYWANAVVPFYVRELNERFPKIPLLVFRGQMSDEDLERINSEFNATKGSCILLATDAGQKGLNLYAPYLFHLELPFTYMAYKQRRDRIDRVDSKSKGIDHTWIYRYLHEGTVEERLEQKVFSRKYESELITGQFDDSVEQQKMSSGELFSMLFD